MQYTKRLRRKEEQRLAAPVDSCQFQKRKEKIGKFETRKGKIGSAVCTTIKGGSSRDSAPVFASLPSDVIEEGRPSDHRLNNTRVLLSSIITQARVIAVQSGAQLPAEIIQGTVISSQIAPAHELRYTQASKLELV